MSSIGYIGFTRWVDVSTVLKVNVFQIHVSMKLDLLTTETANNFTAFFRLFQQLHESINLVVGGR